MQKLFSKAWLPYLILGSLFMMPVHAYGYIDLGTGSYFMQIAIASIVGGLFTIKMYWKKVTSFFRKLFFKKK